MHRTIKATLINTGHSFIVRTSYSVLEVPIVGVKSCYALALPAACPAFSNLECGALIELEVFYGRSPVE